MLSWMTSDQSGHTKRIRNEQSGRVRKVSPHTSTRTEHTAKSEDRSSLFPRGTSLGGASISSLQWGMGSILGRYTQGSCKIACSSGHLSSLSGAAACTMLYSQVLISTQTSQTLNITNFTSISFTNNLAALETHSGSHTIPKLPSIHCPFFVEGNGTSQSCINCNPEQSVCLDLRSQSVEGWVNYGQTQSKYIFSFTVIQVWLPTKIKVLWFSVCIAAVSLCEWKLNPKDAQEPGWQMLWLPAKQKSAFCR